MKPYNIPILFGSAREGAVSANAANYTLEQAKAFGFDTQLVKVADIIDRAQTRLADYSENQLLKSWQAIMAHADGLIIVTPEYNHGYPGELKLAIDSLKKEYANKPVGFVGVGGFAGGTRCVQQLRQVFIELSMHPIRDGVYFSFAKTHFNDKGEMITPDVDERIKIMFEQIAKYAEALRAIRQ